MANANSGGQSRKTAGNKAELLRDKLHMQDVVHLVGAHDGLGARLVEHYGFDGIWASGFEISASHAVPDANILTMSEFLEAATEINDACGLPVIADCDTGFGNSNNVMHMIRKYEAAGIAGVCIEDKKFPKVNSYVAGRQELAPIAEFVGKIMAAKSVQRSESFLLIARVEALIAGWGQEEALKRASAYADAGADMILMHSKADTSREVEAFLRKWKKRLPVVIVPTTYPDIQEKELAELGVKMVIFANQGIRAAVKGMQRALEKIRSDGNAAGLSGREIVSMAEMFDMQGMTRMKEVEKQFLSSDRAVILAAGEPNDASLSAVLGDRPVAMLDINGKSLLERNVEVLNACGIQDVAVVAGYRADAINIKGLNVVMNPDYAVTGTAGSLACVDTEKSKRVLLVYGDVIVGRHLIKRLLEVDGEIVIVVDDSYKKDESDRALDFVVLEEQQDAGIRKVERGEIGVVRAIGKSVTRKEASHEFIGVAVFSKKAFSSAMKLVGESDKARKWSVPDLLAEMCHQGSTVKALQVNSGWKEIHYFKHYREACSMLS